MNAPQNFTWRVAAVCVATWLASAPLHAQTGRFLAVVNEQAANGDSRRSVEYFDADALDDGPLFSVFMGFEEPNNMEECRVVDVDPLTGDVYVLAYDSGAVGPNGDESDTDGDMDLYRVDFSTVYGHWAVNFWNQDVRALGGPLAVGGEPPSGFKNANNLDYVTYGVGGLGDFHPTHSNTYVLANSIAKVGEVKRNHNPDPEPYFPGSLEVLDEQTLLLVDDTSASSSVNSPETDHQYRILDRISTSPGAANDASADHLDGGFNRGTSESWESRRIGAVGLDAGQHSEPMSTASYQDPATGVRGVWVSESQSNLGLSDRVAFLELDAGNNVVGYRPLAGIGATLDVPDDPSAMNGFAGVIEKIFVDQDSGDLVIMESGQSGLIHEPAVLRLAVSSFDNGLGEIELGAWSSKVFLTPQSTPNDSGGRRGQWSAYDSERDLVYMVYPGGDPPQDPAYQMDVWVLDLETGLTTSHLELDDSVSLFRGDDFGDKVEFFSLATPLDADFDDDQDVDGADLLVWQRQLGQAGTNPLGDADGDLIINADDLTVWQSQFGGVTQLASAVPEPMGSLIALVLLSAAWLVRYDASRSAP